MRMGLFVPLFAGVLIAIMSTLRHCLSEHCKNLLFLRAAHVSDQIAQKNIASALIKDGTVLKPVSAKIVLTLH